MNAYFTVTFLAICLIMFCIHTIVKANDKLAALLFVAAFTLMSMTLGAMLKGYDFTNECTYEERAKTQIKLHGLAIQMLNMYFEADPNFFLDVISETDAYEEYNTLVEGDWEDFGLK